MYGDGRAREWGTPTANLKLMQRTLPVKGVFSVDITTENGRVYQGVANLGYRPTFGGTKAVLEVHLFEFSGSLYGQRLEVTFCTNCGMR